MSDFYDNYYRGHWKSIANIHIPYISEVLLFDGHLKWKIRFPNKDQFATLEEHFWKPPDVDSYFSENSYFVCRCF